MDYIILVGLLLIWVVCGIIAYGLTLAHIQKMHDSTLTIYKCNKKELLLHLYLDILAGPISLFLTIFYGIYKNGLQFKCKKSDNDDIKRKQED